MHGYTGLDSGEEAVADKLYTDIEKKREKDASDYVSHLKRD